MQKFVDRDAEFVFVPHETNWIKIRGLRWVASGFGGLGLSDHEILEREFIVYDALYAECTLRASRGLVAEGS